jgi:hypothetical protein
MQLTLIQPTNYVESGNVSTLSSLAVPAPNARAKNEKNGKSKEPRRDDSPHLLPNKLLFSLVFAFTDSSIAKR